MNIRLMLFFGIFFSMGHSLQAMESDSWSQWIKKQLVKPSSSNTLIKEDNKENEKFPWYKLPNELKWKIAQMGGKESLEMSLLKNCPSGINVGHEINLPECDTRIATISHDGTQLALAGNNLRVIKIIDIGSGTILHEHRLSDQKLTCLAWHPKENKIAYGFQGKETLKGGVAFFDLKKPSKALPRIKYDGIQSLDWHSDGIRLALAGKSGVNIWNGNVLKMISPDSSNIIKWNKQGTHFAYCKDIESQYLGKNNVKGLFPHKCRIFIWDATTELEKQGIHFNLPDRSPIIKTIAWDAKGQKIAVGLDTGSAGIMKIGVAMSMSGSLANKRCIHDKPSNPWELERCFICNGREVTSLKYHPKKDLLLVACENNDTYFNYPDLYTKFDKYGLSDKIFSTESEVRNIFWFNDGIGYFLLLKDKLKSYWHALPISPQTKIKRSVNNRYSSIDPLKLFLSFDKLKKLYPKKNESKDRDMLAVLGLEKIGLPKDEIDNLLSTNKDLLVGPEEYDYNLFLKEQFRVGLKDIKVGLKGKDISIKGLLEDNFK